MKVDDGFDKNASGYIKKISENSMSGPKIKRRKVIKLYVNKSLLPFIVKIIKSNEAILLKNVPGIRFFVDDINKYVREMSRKVADLTEANAELENKILYLQGQVDLLKSRGERMNLDDIKSSIELDLIRDQLLKDYSQLNWWNIFQKYRIKQQLLEIVCRY